ncbi:MAG: hypothetical protein EOP11_07885 [Proteobacteria bacterium]|nr:MAG: hypothetical protein EOP11_07885 [Pseudomonadota bacterium]
MRRNKLCLLTFLFASLLCASGRADPATVTATSSDPGHRSGTYNTPRFPEEPAARDDDAHRRDRLSREAQLSPDDEAYEGGSEDDGAPSAADIIRRGERQAEESRQRALAEHRDAERSQRESERLRERARLGIDAAPAASVDQPCPKGAPDLSAAQARLSSSLSDQYSGNAFKALEWLEKCYPRKAQVPACLQRAYNKAEYQLVRGAYDSKPVVVENEINMRRPPEEFLVTGDAAEPVAQPSNSYGFGGVPPGETNDPSLNKISLNMNGKDAEQIAKEKGWPVVRYKSRHSGGFDEGTPSLLMIHVPGAQRTPPVDYDQFINIALPADPEDLNADLKSADVKPIPRAAIPTKEQYEKTTGMEMPRTTTMVTVQKGKPGEPSRVFFDKFNRRRGTNIFTAEKSQQVLSSCYSCHPGGLRAISPLGYSVNHDQIGQGQTMADEMWKKIQAMNGAMNSMQRYRSPDYGSILDAKGKARPAVNAEGMGPLYGALKPLNRKVITKPDGTKEITYPTRSKDFIMGDGAGNGGCATSQETWNLRDIFMRAPGRDNSYTVNRTLPTDWQKVKKAMNCASCHNSALHGPLNAQVDFSTIAYKVLVDQSMPLLHHQNPLEHGGGNSVQDSLNLNERIALVNCLRDEFEIERTKTKEWLTEVSCAPKARAGAEAPEATPAPSSGGKGSPTNAQDAR